MVRQGPRTGGCRTGTWVWVRRGPGSGSDRALNPTLTAVSSLGPYSATYDLSGRDATAQLSEGTEGVLSKLKEPTSQSSRQGSGFSTKGPRGGGTQARRRRASVPTGTDGKGQLMVPPPFSPPPQTAGIGVQESVRETTAMDHCSFVPIAASGDLVPSLE